MAYYKVTIEMVLLLEHDGGPEGMRKRLCEMPLGAVEYEMTDGEFFGVSFVSEVVEVPQHQIKDELKKLGNDGTFFDASSDPDRPE
jgi:hypothetical protein